MFEARLVLESSLAALAAERSTGDHLAELAEEVAEMYAALDNPQEYLIHDVRFHRTVARAAGNPILAALMETITANLYDRRLATVHHSVDLKQSAEMHRDIYRAIRSRNPTLARQTMERHLNLAQQAQEAEAAQTNLQTSFRTSSPAGLPALLLTPASPALPAASSTAPANTSP